MGTHGANVHIIWYHLHQLTHWASYFEPFWQCKIRHELLCAMTAKQVGLQFCISIQGQARGYGHITQQYLIFGRTTGGQHFQLEYLQRYLKNCFASFIL